MIEINIDSVIGKGDPFYEMFGIEEKVVSNEIIKQILNDNPDEKDFKLIINSPGGSVDEGFTIYDTLRSSGKNIYAHIEGECHSMAVTLLLAAPLENRTANPNARALIHEVSTEVWDSVTEHSAQAITDMLREYKNKILDIYTDRTGRDKEDLKNILEEEKVRFTDFLIDYGFISKTTNYTTNLNPRNMSTKARQLLNAIAKKCGKTVNELIGKVENYDYTNKEGVTLFSTEGEEQDLAVNDAVTIASGETSGTFRIEKDGADVDVIIVDNVVTEINPVEAENTSEEVEILNGQVSELAIALEEEATTNEALETEVANLQEQLNVANTSLSERDIEITNLKKKVVSNHVPKGRAGSMANKTQSSVDGLIDGDTIRENLKKLRKKN